MLDKETWVERVHSILVDKGFRVLDAVRHRFQLTDELLITVTATQNGYVGVRHIDYDDRKHYDEYDYPLTAVYRKRMGQYGYTGHSVWLGRKTFARYCQMSADAVSATICELEELSRCLSLPAVTTSSPIRADMTPDHGTDEVITAIGPLQTWADNTAKAYVSLTRQLGAEAPAFYTQSDLRKVSLAPSVMILGINPGSGGTYAGQKDNVNWGLNGEDMTGAQLLRGNYCKSANGRTSWEMRENMVYWQRLKNYFSLCEGGNPLDDETDFVLTNMSFFNTCKANEIANVLLLQTMPWSLRLIDIIRPRTLIFLSGKLMLKRLDTISRDNGLFRLDYTETAPSVYQGKFNGIPCLGVPHPSAHLRREERNTVRECMADFMKSR